MSFDIQNKIALVTGANRGIGKAIVESFLAHGAKKVYLGVRKLESVKDFEAEYGDRVQALHVDYLQAQTIADLAKVATDVDIVVNNAGLLEIADPLAAGAEAALRTELEVNTFGLIRIAQAFAPILKANGGGALVQLNSVASIKNFADFATYSASKAASYSLTQGLRDKFADQNTQVLSVHPGPIKTDMSDKAGFGDAAEPVSIVAEGIVASLKSGDFHLFPDSMAKSFEAGYQSYAQNVIEAQAVEA